MLHPNMCKDLCQRSILPNPAGSKSDVTTCKGFGRCRPSWRSHIALQTSLAGSPGMITALASVGGCHAGGLANRRERCCIRTRVHLLPRLRCGHSLTSNRRSQRISPCRAQAGAAVAAPAPQMAVRLRHARHSIGAAALLYSTPLHTSVRCQKSAEARCAVLTGTRA